jgi:beta-galactosidase/beta-glucuronidase
MKSIEEVVREKQDAPPEALVAALMEREDEMADTLRMAGIQFGVYPAIVAKVFKDVGIGTPPTEDVGKMIDAQFVALMEAFQRAAEQGDPPPAP